SEFAGLLAGDLEAPEDDRQSLLRGSPDGNGREFPHAEDLRVLYIHSSAVGIQREWSTWQPACGIRGGSGRNSARTWDLTAGNACYPDGYLHCNAEVPDHVGRNHQAVRFDEAVQSQNDKRCEKGFGK